jgi:hypothetical protein
MPCIICIIIIIGFIIFFIITCIFESCYGIIKTCYKCINNNENKNTESSKNTKNTNSVFIKTTDGQIKNKK